MATELKCAQHFLFQVNHLLLLKRDVVLFFKHEDETIEVRRDWLLNLGCHEHACHCKRDQIGSSLSLNCDVYQVSIGKTDSRIDSF